MLAPSTEIASILRHRVQQEFAAGAARVWRTPAVRDFSTWALERYTERADARRVLSVFESFQLWGDAIAASAAGPELLDLGAAARAARSARRIMRDHGITARELRASGSPESLAFLQWSATFDDRCQDLGVIDADDAISSLSSVSAQEYWLDSPTWRPSILKVLKSNENGMLRGERSPSTRQSSHLTTAADPAIEWSAAARWARSRLEAELDFRAWVYLPAAEGARAAVARAFDLELASARFDLSTAIDGGAYAIAGGEPLQSYATVREAMASLAALRGEIEFVDFSALLRSLPLRNTSALEQSMSARLDVELRHHAADRASLETFLSMSEKVASERNIPRPAALTRLAIMQSIVAAVPQNAVMSHWVSRWNEALNQGLWRESVSASSQNFQVVTRFKELLSDLARSDAIFGSLDWHRALSILRRAARETSFQPHTGIPAIWVTTRLQDPWLAYDGVWISRAHTQSWPPPAAPAALIPLQLQIARGVRASSPELQLNFARELQARWRLRAAELHFSFAREPEMEAHPSLLMPGDVVRLEVSHDAAAIHARPAQSVHWVPYSPEQALPMSGVDRARGVRSLSEQSRCAFRGFAFTRLRGDEIHTPHPGFNRMERGSLLHDALHVIWSELGGSQRLILLSRDEEQRLIRRAVESSLQRQRRKRDPGRTWALREQRRMSNILAAWLTFERARPPFDVHALEKQYAVSFGGLPFNVRIDRIDAFADGGMAVIDYKTGAVSRDWETERPENAQLLMYALAVDEPLAAIAYAQLTAESTKFLGAAEKCILGSQRGGFEGGESAQTMRAHWRRRMDVIAAELRHGSFIINPLPWACGSCHFAAICRSSTLA